MFTWLSAVVILLVASSCEALSRLPNVRYLGIGYNVISGNPESNLHDPGFKFNVLKFTWENNDTTSDRRYLVPDNIQALEAKSCGFRSHAATEFGDRSYQQALSTDVSVESEANSWLWKARFSASDDYKKFSQGATQYRRLYTSARAKCTQYQLSVNYVNSPINVTSNFAQAVRSLPLVRNDSAYNDFIINYGTHFTKNVTMGAKMVIRSEFDEVAFSKMEESGLSAEIGAKASFLRFTAGLNAETRTERKRREMFEASRRTNSSSYLGSHPPSDGKWESWANSTAESPYPVRYVLAPLTKLFTAKFFPDMSLIDLNTRRDLLTAAYSRYCSGTVGCGTPAADRLPVRMSKQVSRFHVSTYVSCPPGYSLLSCGILNVRASGSYDMRRYANPEYPWCYCSDLFEAQCVAWCANIAVQFRRVTSNFVQGSITVSCPSGYKACTHSLSHFLARDAL